MREQPVWRRFLHRPDPARVLGDRIVGFALSQEGKQVGDGECYALVDDALTTAGAKTASAYTGITPDADYVWGTPVPLRDVRPGDILQFRNFHIRRLVTRTLRDANGDVASTQSEEVEERDHHTAVVERNLGGSVAILEQNVDPLGRVVQRRQIQLFAGIFSQSDPADTSQLTTQISVEGVVRAYRPDAALKLMAAHASGAGMAQAAVAPVKRDF